MIALEYFSLFITLINVSRENITIYITIHTLGYYFSAQINVINAYRLSNSVMKKLSRLSTKTLSFRTLGCLLCKFKYKTWQSLIMRLVNISVYQGVTNRLAKKIAKQLDYRHCLSLRLKKKDSKHPIIRLERLKYRGKEKDREKHEDSSLVARASRSASQTVLVHVHSALTISNEMLCAHPRS